MTFRRRRLVAVPLVATMLLAPVARAQDGGIEGADHIDDGAYTGTIGLSGRISHTVAQGSIVWTGAFQGPAELVIDGGSASGAWSLTGPATVSGRWSGGISVNGQQTVSAAGDFGGSSGDYFIDGTVTTTGSVTANTPAGAVTQPINDSSTGSHGTIDRLLFTCDHLYGEFSYPIEQELNSDGFSVETDGTLLLVREPFTSEVKEQLVDLHADMQDARARLDPAMLNSGEEATAIAELEALLGASIAISEQLADSPCPPDAQYLEYASGLILSITGTLMARALDAWVAAEPGSPQWTQAMIDIYALTVVLSGTGATGEPFGEELLGISHDFFEDVINLALDSMDEASPDGEWPPFEDLEPWLQDAIAVSLAAGSTMGWTYVRAGGDEQGQTFDPGSIVEVMQANA